MDNRYNFKLIVMGVSISVNLLYGENKFYSISTCTTKDYDGALYCKKKIAKSVKDDIYIVQNDDGKYRTVIGKFNTIADAKKLEKSLSKIVKDQGPFVKMFNLSDNSIKFIEKFQMTNFQNGVKLDLQSMNSFSEEPKPQINIQQNKISITEEGDLNKKNVLKDIKNLDNNKSDLVTTQQPNIIIPRNEKL